MTEATKAKLKVLGVAPAVADKLEAMSLFLPFQIKLATKKALEEAGLTKAEITELRKVMPERKA
jgi:hypothetical protein